MFWEPFFYLFLDVLGYPDPNGLPVDGYLFDYHFCVPLLFVGGFVFNVFPFWFGVLWFCFRNLFRLLGLLFLGAGVCALLGFPVKELGSCVGACWGVGEVVLVNCKTVVS